MKKKVEYTKVIFRVWHEDGEVIALFPAEAGTPDPSTCSSYEHMGQHGATNYQLVIHATRPATIGESKELARELTGLGYNLTSAYRQSRKDRAAIREQINR